MSGLALAPAAFSAAQTTAAGNPANSDDIQEVTVTAQKRTENIRDVPISITALTTGDLDKAGVSTNLDLGKMVPGLVMDRSTFSTPTVRGITTTVTGNGVEPNVATYIDGVYQASSAAAVFDLPDVNRIDVLKGPQGTLFGRNATGGAIEIFTIDPSQTATGHISAGYGSYNDQVVKGYISGPLVDGKLYASISGFEETQDSYQKNIGPNDFTPTGLSAHSLRAKFLWTPTDDMKFTFIGYTGMHDSGDTQNGIPLKGVTVAAGVPGGVVPTKPWDIAENINGKQNIVMTGGSGKGEFDTGIGVITTTAAYNYDNSHNVLPATAGYVPTGADAYIENTPDHNIQAEVNLASPKYGPFSYIAGLNYYNSDERWSPLDVGVYGANTQSMLDRIYTRQTSESYAAYTEATWEFTPDLSAILGARYSYETRKLYGDQYLGVFPSDTDAQPGGWLEQGSVTFTKTTPRFSIRYKTDPTTTIYFTYSEGFKSGLYAPTSLPLVFDGKSSVKGNVYYVRPETLNSYEIGLKSAPKPWLSFDASTFLYKYTNEQFSAYEYTNGVPLDVVQNAASSTLYGAELEATAKPWHDWTFKAGLSLLHAQFDSFPAGAALVTNPGGVGATSVAQNLSGTNLPRAPNWTVDFSGTYAHDFDFGHLATTVSLYHSEQYLFQPGVAIVQPAYTTIGAQIAWQPLGQEYTVALYGKNLTNEAVLAGTFMSQSSYNGYYQAPREIGFTLSYDF